MKPQKTEDCRPVCPETEDRWYLPAGVLNILWADVIPLLAARCWRGETCPFGVDNAGLADLIRELPGWGRSGPWRARAQLVVDTLGRDDCAPIRIIGEGGYDFLLSNQGVDIFLPERPESADDLYRFYTFRRTGRGPIAIPRYLTDPVSARSANSRTGPSQLWVDPRSVLDLADLFPEDCEPAKGLRKKVERLVEKSKDSCEARRHKFEDPARPAVPDERLALLLEGVGNLICMLEETRCWQVEGAVAQAIFTETHRVVATIWMDPAGSYATRWTEPSDGGLREIFEERLEVSLPGESRMGFTLHPTSHPASPPWDPGDIMITSRGFFFPPLPETPDLGDMLDEIVEGKASNPVFTDSMPPPWP